MGDIGLDKGNPEDWDDDSGLTSTGNPLGVKAEREREREDDEMDIMEGGV